MVARTPAATAATITSTREDKNDSRDSELAKRAVTADGSVRNASEKRPLRTKKVTRAAAASKFVSSNATAAS
jgi:hypothetical protein